VTRRTITPTCYLVEEKTRQEWNETLNSSEMPDYIVDRPVRDITGSGLEYLRCGFQGLGAVPLYVPDARLISASFARYYRALAAAVHPLGYRPGVHLMSRIHCEYHSRFLCDYYLFLSLTLCFVC